MISRAEVAKLLELRTAGPSLLSLYLWVPLDPAELRGSLRSGSGTIVRQAVAYAALTGQPVRVRNARARRRQPGLRAQHVRAVQAIRDLVGGSLDGAEVGSRSFEFLAGSRRAGRPVCVGHRHRGIGHHAGAVGAARRGVPRPGC